MSSRLLHYVGGVVVVALAAGTRVEAQAVPAWFEVVSIKRVVDRSYMLYRFDVTAGGRLSAANVNLWDLILRAHGLPVLRVVNVPQWAEREYFDIEARARSDIQPQDLAPMLRDLLRERFGLRTHTESREMPAYALVVARGDGAYGSGLRPAARDCAAFLQSLREWDRAHQGGAPVNPACESRTTVTQGIATLRFPASTMADLARLFQDWVGRVVVDETQLPGEFDIAIQVNAEDVPVLRQRGLASAPPASDGPSLLTALREQLGLKLEPGRRPVEVLVVDQVALPAAD